MFIANDYTKTPKKGSWPLYLILGFAYLFGGVFMLIKLNTGGSSIYGYIFFFYLLSIPVFLIRLIYLYFKNEVAVFSSKFDIFIFPIVLILCILSPLLGGLADGLTNPDGNETGTFASIVIATPLIIAALLLLYSFITTIITNKRHPFFGVLNGTVKLLVSLLAILWVLSRKWFDK